MKSRTLFGLLLSYFAFAAMTAHAGQLNVGYYTPAKMPMTVVFPRPDAEVSNGARQKWAFADGKMQYRIPIAIQGGAYPFYVSSTSGLPSGLTISSDPNSADYMKAIWTPASGDKATYNCSVVIKDQDGKTVTVTWSVTAVGDDGSHFIFIDPKAGTNGSGTKASPFNTMVGIGIRQGTGTNPLSGKAIILRGGTTKFYGPESSGNYFFDAKIQNPGIFLGYTGEIAQLDMSTGAFKNWGQDDVYFGQLTLKNAAVVDLSGESDTIAYFDQGNTKRSTFFENTFYNIQLGGTSTNSAAITFWHPGVLRNYLTVIGNTMDNFNVPLVDIYATKYGVIDRNTFQNPSDNMSGEPYLMLKVDDQYFSIRGNSALDSLGSASVLRLHNGATQFGNDYIEVAYNVVLIKPSAPAKEALWTFNNNTSYNVNPHVFIYRNTFNGDVNQNDVPGTIVYENNVFITDGGSYGKLCGTIYKLSPCTKLNVTANDIASDLMGNLYGKTSDGLIDQYGMLINSASKHLGRLGYQISDGTPPLSFPTWR